MRESEGASIHAKEFDTRKRQADSMADMTNSYKSKVTPTKTAPELSQMLPLHAVARYLFLEPNPGDPLNHEAAEVHPGRDFSITVLK